jgi:hypothetical protein
MFGILLDGIPIYGPKGMQWWWRAGSGKSP